MISRGARGASGLAADDGSTEQADLARERNGLSEKVGFEREELADIYLKRGVDPTLARQVADQLMAKNASMIGRQ